MIQGFIPAFASELQQKLCLSLWVWRMRIMWVTTRREAIQFSFQAQRRTMPKNVQTTPRTVLISHASKVMLKILQVRLQQYMNWELPDVQVGFRKGRGTRDQIAKIHWIIEKAREFQKMSTSASLTTLKPLTAWVTTNYGKFIKRWEYQTTWPASWETCMQVKKQQLEPWNNGLVQNWERSISQLYIVTLLI